MYVYTLFFWLVFLFQILSTIEQNFITPCGLPLMRQGNLPILNSTLHINNVKPIAQCF